jgi:hypothetical protein
MFDIDTYRSKFIGNNARQHLFYCNVQFPGIQNTLMSGLSSGLSVANGLSNLTTAVENGLVNAGTTAINDGAVHEVEFGRNGTKFYLLQDGVLQATSANWSGTFAAGLNAEPLWFGNDQYTTNRYFSGQLYDFQYYLGIGPATANYTPLATMPCKNVNITIPSNAQVGDSFRFKTGPGPSITKLSDGRSYLPNQDITLVYNGSTFQK